MKFKVGDYVLVKEGINGGYHGGYSSGHRGIVRKNIHPNDYDEGDIIVYFDHFKRDDISYVVKDYELERDELKYTSIWQAVNGELE